jgi:putative ABC transport system substrate-binding protein
MRRRKFIALIGGAAASWPLPALAQQGERMRRIGVLMGYAETDPAAQAQVAALRQELQKLGWDEGRNIRIDVRFPGTDAGRIRAMLMELISLTPDDSHCLCNRGRSGWQRHGREPFAPRRQCHGPLGRAERYCR